MSEHFPTPEHQETEENLSPVGLGKIFNESRGQHDLRSILREELKKNPSARFSIVAEWKNIHKARDAKAIWDLDSSSLNIDSITIRATREQFEEDVNAFASGVKWEEIE